MKASLVGCTTTVAALTAIVVAATFALGENRSCAQSATGASMQTVAPDGGGGNREAGGALGHAEGGKQAPLHGFFPGHAGMLFDDLRRH